MAETALACYGVYLVVAVGVRVLLQLRATGSSGIKGVSGSPGSAEWSAGVLFFAAIALSASAPPLALNDVVEPIDALDRDAVHVAGLALFGAGLVATFAAQVAMGASWRIGVDPDERTELVTGGPFALVRNPIFAAMLPAFLGLTLLVPSTVAIAGLAVLFIALELQVRLVEEPYLRRVHGEAFGRYAARTGRFLPGVGRLKGSG